MAKRESPWLMRTYSGHSSARASNELYRTNLTKGQTGLSVAFDLPTQTGYDADHPLARGEVGKVGVPVSSIADMDILFQGLPLEKMNTSMTINATAAWLLALYVALAEQRGLSLSQLRGTTQNDIFKEYLSRGAYIFPPAPSLRLTVDTVAYSIRHLPKWNPVNICSYHLQEAGATPVQELAYSLSAAVCLLDAIRMSGQIESAEMPGVVGRLSFFVNSGIRFLEECCKMRAFVALWDELCLNQFHVEDPELRRFRYGVQVNSLGLTEQQPENNVQRIVLETLGVLLSKNARARALQLPAWNEALGLPRPWDQQWSLRIQQVLAYETDLLEYEDIFDGSLVIEQKVQALIEETKLEMERVLKNGGVISAIESGYLKQQLVQSHATRLRAIQNGEQTIVGVNRFTETSPSLLVHTATQSILKVDPQAEQEQIEALLAFRSERNPVAVQTALESLKTAAQTGANIMPSSIQCAHSGVTTGEWSDALRNVFGEWRAPTGTQITIHESRENQRSSDMRKRVIETSQELGRPLRLLVGKPGLDGHSNGAEQIAVKAKEIGIEVIYQGIRLTPQQIATAAEEEGAHIVGLSILSGSHQEMVKAILQEMDKLEIQEIPLVVGGIIPPEDEKELLAAGVAAVFTPKDNDFNHIFAVMVDVVRGANGLKKLGPL